MFVLDNYPGLGDHWLIDIKVAMSSSRRTVILGFGVTGQSVARYLCANETIPTVLDSRSAQPLADDWQALDIRWESDNWPTSVLAQTDRAIVSPGLPLHHPLVEQARRANIELLSDIDLFMSKVDAPVIGVTGTNGKSTVVSLVGHLLSASGLACAVGGNLGVLHWTCSMMRMRCTCWNYPVFNLPTAGHCL